MELGDYPRVDLTHAPTPFEPMAALSADLGGPALWVKRDDCTGLAMGGNKSRQLEFYFGEAQTQGADTVIITGAVQSNFLRMTAAAAAKLGMACEIQHEDRVTDMGPAYHTSGNVLLDHLYGAKIHTYPEGEDEAGADRAMHDIADRVRSEGGTPYVIHLGADHPPLGALGYIDCAKEILDQAAAAGVTPDTLVVPSGSAATHAGILAGLRYHGSDLPVLGICVRRGVSSQQGRVLTRGQEVAEMVNRPGLIKDDDVWVDDCTLAPGYGRINDATKEAMTLAARREGLLTDPVYSGKTLAGLIDNVRRGVLKADSTVVFLHTGGLPALFAYGDQL